MSQAITPTNANCNSARTVDLSVKRSASIITRLTLIVAGILVTAVLVTGSLALFDLRRQLEQALTTKANSLVEFLAQVSPLSVLSLNFVEMNNNTKKVVLSDDEVVYAIIVNAHNIPFAQFFKETDPLMTRAIKGLLAERNPLAASDALKRSGLILEATAPIMSGERPLGTVIMGFSHEKMQRALRNQVIMVAALLVLIIGSSSLLLRWVLRRILHPVQELTNAATQISTGDLNVRVTGTEKTDELGILARAFVSMTGQLRGLIAGLKQSEEHFRTAFENANVGVCLVATDGRLLKVNQAMCSMFGYTREEMEKMTVDTIAHPDDKGISPSFIADAISGKAHQASFEKRCLSKGGKIVWVHVSTAMIHDSRGQPLYFISHVQDVTERKRAEEELVQLNQALDQRVKERTAALESRNEELQQLNSIFVNRELRMVELKNRIHALEAELTASSNQKNHGIKL